VGAGERVGIDALIVRLMRCFPFFKIVGLICYSLNCLFGSLSFGCFWCVDAYIVVYR